MCMNMNNSELSLELISNLFRMPQVIAIVKHPLIINMELHGLLPVTPAVHFSNKNALQRQNGKRQ